MTKRNLKNKRIRLAAITAALSTGGIVIALLPSANAGQAPNKDSNRHFIHIATHGAPLWKAEAWLKDGKGKEVYHWEEGPKSGDYALWYFTDGGDGGKIKVTIKAIGGASDRSTEEFNLDRDRCFLVNAIGVVRYTGDNQSGNCTPD